jgi:hypothetical protein
MWDGVVDIPPGKGRSRLGKLLIQVSARSLSGRIRGGLWLLNAFLVTPLCFALLFTPVCEFKERAATAYPVHMLHNVHVDQQETKDEGKQNTIVAANVTVAKAELALEVIVAVDVQLSWA